MLSCKDVLTVTKQGKEMQAHLFWKILEQSLTAL